MTLNKTCYKCSTTKPIADFAKGKDRADGYKNYCKACNAKRAADTRDIVFRHYGGYVCVCCGETKPQFLTIDHINNDGAKQRRESVNHGKNLYRWLQSHHFPEGFQVLCMNCNLGKWRNGGICPHVS